MAIATGTAIAIAAATSAGATVYGAKKAADASKQATTAEATAAKDAATTQAASAKEALDFAKTVYGDRTAALSPYSQVGASSIGKLSDLMGLPAPVAAAKPAQPNQLPMDPTHIPPGQNFPSSWVPRSPNAVMGGSRDASGGTPTGGTAVPRGAAVGGVLMRAPDGSVRTVPQAFVQMAIAKGAKPVSGDVTQPPAQGAA